MSTTTLPLRKPTRCEPRRSVEAQSHAAQSICPTCGRNEGITTNDPTFLDIIFSSFIPAVLSFTVPYAYVLGYYVTLYILRREMSYHHSRTIKQKNASVEQVLEIVPQAVQHAKLDPHLSCINRFGSNQVVNHDSRINLKRRRNTATTEDVRSILRPYQNSLVLIRDQNYPRHRGYERPIQAAKINELMELVVSWNDRTSQMVSAGYLSRIPGVYNKQYKFQEGDMVRAKDSVFLQYQRYKKSKISCEEGDTLEEMGLVEIWDSLTIEMCDHFYLAIFPDANS